MTAVFDTKRRGLYRRFSSDDVDVALTAVAVSMMLAFFSVAEVYYGWEGFWSRLAPAFLAGGIVALAVFDLREMVICMALSLGLAVTMIVIFWMLPAVLGFIYSDAVVNILTYQVGMQAVNFLLIKPIVFLIGIIIVGMYKAYR